MSELHNCLISELSKLKESSKEAVENIESFNRFKQYMHIKREVEDKLKELVEKSIASPTNHLILVCGSVGDGKSHILSYLKSQNPEICEHFYIHNDATESNAPDKTSMDTLFEVLKDFSDEALVRVNPPQNILLAINLGTLNNFLNSEYANQFTYLKEYVLQKNILEAKIEENIFEEESKFQFVNFSDYHLFSLSKDGPVSNFIESILNKLTARREENPFYQNYRRNCLQSCSISDRCPVKYNYELLMYEKVKKAIVTYIAEISIKYKTIISSRTLLDFFYHILVDTELEQKSVKNTFEKYVDDLDTRQRFLALMPNLFFNFSNVSETFKNLVHLDPINTRSEALDTLTIAFYNTNSYYTLFENYIDNKLILDTILQGITKDMEIDDRKVGLQTLLRLYAFSPNEDNKSLDIQDVIYHSYVKDLYYWNKGERSQLRELYQDIVINGIHEWNGESEPGRINIYPGRNQLKYTISQSIKIKPYTDNLKELKEKYLDKFLTYMILQFVNSNENDSIKHEIRLDYPLYDLLVRIKDGYRPNKQDKNNFINFVDFISNIIENTKEQELVKITEKIGKELKQYELTYHKDFGQFEFKEI
ncbi:DNA phosphorothioation-dependent restriction protein DptF [Bacillus toyonensis]|uniref:DNA phosphorothioation-dependent restriction protein DptF n=1 Tax=Bacillus toyonensis TaxID=155322 RepID=UPI0001A06D8A|nr:DNA phosphorothioation-dependent restriction protein DptF [Bacillus toyonensis]EEL22912.1 Dnd system-associated protein 3 [Bacillus cereus Rock1-3]KAB2405542.1 DNA phosphorothioation-dependent restriction protein DptF [Bacillus toyonensis]PEL70527.1 DNA phosphorothioation-dependent restriction protein DptF [Bacillus toyonensis]PHE44130.1 DNA phosphorothioation-dependent restriction protein DptF [Bacillus toyonensis]HDR7537285.1 DNA phosphorothioation-dependent restriction protein DptF [Baci